MSIENYLINSAEKINKLKSDLMASNKNPPYSMKSLSSAFSQLQNKKIGIKFEENIRQTLKNVYGWEEVNFPREFSYRILEYNGRRDIFIENFEKKFVISQNKIILNGNNITIVDPVGKREIVELNKTKINKFKFGEKELIIGAKERIEVDGIFSAKTADFTKFDNEEIKIIYNNVDYIDLKNYEYIIMEIKLSQKKIKDLTNQLIRDKFIFELATRKKNLFLGFAQVKDIKFNYVDKMKNVEFILIGLINSYFAKKNMEEYIDWEGIKDIVNLNNRFDSLDNRIDNLDNRIDNLDNRIDNFDNRINSLNQCFYHMSKEITNIKNILIGEKDKRNPSSPLESEDKKDEEAVENQTEEAKEGKVEKRKKKVKNEMIEKINYLRKRHTRLGFKKYRIHYLRYLLQENLKRRNSQNK